MQLYKESMNTAALILIIPFLGFLVISASTNYNFAQYTGSGERTGITSLEEQLELAKEKVSRAQQEDAYSSGYSISDYRFNCDSILDRSYIIDKTLSRSNLTFNDSVNFNSGFKSDSDRKWI